MQNRSICGGPFRNVKATENARGNLGHKLPVCEL